MNQKQTQQLMSAVAIIQCCSRAVAKKIGITEREMQFIFKLSDGGSYCQSDICQSCFFPKTTVHSMVSDYANKGYVELITQEGKKEKIIHLSKTGKAFADHVIKEMYEIESQLFSEYGAPESASFVEKITQLAEHFQNGMKAI